MQSETLVIEMTLVAVPLPPEKEEAYWEAIHVLVELIWKRAAQIREAQSLDGGGLRSEPNGSMELLLVEDECSTDLAV